MWGSPFNPRVKCFLCQGTGAVYLCKNPIKENMVKKANEKKKEKGEKEQIIGDIKTPCFQCGGMGYFQIDPDSEDFKGRHNLL